MSVEADISLESLRKEHFKTCCKPAYRVKWLSNKGAILVITLNYLVASVFFLLRAGYKVNSDDPVQFTGIILMSSTLLYPIGGWLADTHIGRYKMIFYSIWIMWISIMLATFNEVLAHVVTTYEASSRVMTAIYGVLCVIMAIGLGGFQSNIVQLGIDQLAYASATEISSFITWYTLTLFASGLTLHYISDCVVEEYNMFYVKLLVVAVFLTLALCSVFLFHHWLVKEQTTENVLHLMLKFIQYTIANRKFRHDFATNKELPSLFDVANYTHGRAYRAQQVENICRFLWMLVVIAACAIVGGAVAPLEYAKDKMEYHIRVSEITGLIGCYRNLIIHYNGYFFAIVLALIFEFIVHPLFTRCLPTISITNRFLFGAVSLLILVVSLLVIEAIASKQEWQQLSNNITKNCIFTASPKVQIHFNTEWLVIPGFMGGLSNLLLILSALEFIWSQAPMTMKGLALGCMYALLGLSVMLHSTITSPFVFMTHIQWKHSPLTCGTWYFLIEGVIILVVLIVIGVLVKRYKKRNASFDLYTHHH